MTQQPVVSSNIAGVGYDAQSRSLVVQFKNGKQYRYEGIDQSQYAGMLGAPSKGQYLNSVIKPSAARVIPL